MKYIIGLVAMLLPVLSQGQFAVKPLTIGDRVPDITIANVYNYPASSIHLSDLRGKPVLLDFWATWCGSCIGTFPEMNDLQHVFKDKIQLILVNSYYPDNISKVKTFFRKWEARTGLPFDVAYALQDSTLSDIFYHKQIPHYVWINQKGIVSAITSQDAVNEHNLALFLKNGQIDLPVKNDKLLFNPEKPLLVDENSGDDPTFIYHSVITGFKRKLGAMIGQRTNEDRKIKRLFVINYSLLALFQKAYPDVFRIPVSRMIVEASQGITKAFNEPDSFKYCYEIITSPSNAAEIKKYMQEDLFRTFHLKAKNETRNISCYVLKLNGNITRSMSRGGTPGTDAELTTIHKQLKNEPVSELAGIVEAVTRKPVINETGYSGNIDVTFPKDLYSLSYERLAAFLQARGFTLVPGKRPMKAIVITDQ